MPRVVTVPARSSLPLVALAVLLLGAAACDGAGDETPTPGATTSEAGGRDRPGRGRGNDPGLGERPPRPPELTGQSIDDLECPDGDMVYESHTYYSATQGRSGPKGHGSPEEAVQRGLRPEMHLPPGLFARGAAKGRHVGFEAHVRGKRVAQLLTEEHEEGWLIDGYRACNSFLLEQKREAEQ